MVAFACVGDRLRVPLTSFLAACRCVGGERLLSSGGDRGGDETISAIWANTMTRTYFERKKKN